MGGWSVLLLSLNVCVVHLCLWSYLLQFLVEAFSLLVMNFVVESCCLSSGVVQFSVLLLLHARTHLKQKKKKKKKLHLLLEWLS
jgi:hypothetical protein